MNASATDQLRLLDLQALDTRLDQLAHRRKTLPEHAEVQRLEGVLRELRDRIVAAETEKSDVEREQAKAETDVQQVRDRAARDQQRLDSGAVSSPRELEQLQSEVASLARRQQVLEDEELEVMQRLEDVEHHLAGLQGQRAQTQAELDDVVARRDAQLAEVAQEEATTKDLRGTLGGQIDGALVTLYEKVRGQSGGIGAAPLLQRRCMGCRLELNTTDLGRIRTAAEDEVLRCEECRRILVRTPESGL
ncbi:MAG: zinc ribbon domain-containing protein [Motilibacteraceae bacterium]